MGNIVKTLCAFIIFSANARKKENRKKITAEVFFQN